jgi:hypothetical protein
MGIDVEAVVVWGVRLKVSVVAVVETVNDSGRVALKLEVPLLVEVNWPNALLDAMQRSAIKPAPMKK